MVVSHISTISRSDPACVSYIYKQASESKARYQWLTVQGGYEYI